MIFWGCHTAKSVPYLRESVSRLMGRELKLNMKTALAQVLSPQMQESLAILASPILELRNKVNEELEKNPVLELDEDAPAPEVKGDLADPASESSAQIGSVSTASTDDYGKRTVGDRRYAHKQPLDDRERDSSE